MESNKRIVLRQHSEIWSKGNVSLCDEFYTPDSVCHFPIGPQLHGPEGVKEHVNALRTAFPDWHEEVEEIIAEGDKVVTRFVSTGTQMGVFEGIPATERRVKVQEVAIFRLVDGKIAELWGFPDIAGMRDQLRHDVAPDSGN